MKFTSFYINRSFSPSCSVSPEGMSLIIFDIDARLNVVDGRVIFELGPYNRLARKVSVTLPRNFQPMHRITIKITVLTLLNAGSK